MADFMRVKHEKAKIKQFQIANQLGLSSSTLQIYRNDIKMLSPDRVNPYNNNKRTKKASNTNFENNSHTNHDVKRPQMTSRQPQTNQLKRKRTN